MTRSGLRELTSRKTLGPAMDGLFNPNSGDAKRRGFVGRSGRGAIEASICFIAGEHSFAAEMSLGTPAWSAAQAAFASVASKAARKQRTKP